MAENPLLPNAELGALYTLLQAAQKAELSAARRMSAKLPRPRSTSTAPVRREAVLAGTILQLRPGDLLLSHSGDVTAQAVLQASAAAIPDRQAHSPALSPELPLVTAAVAMSAALKAAGTGQLALALAPSGIFDANWTAALRWAQERQLPFILTCTDPSGSRAFLPSRPARPDALTWDTLDPFARKLGLPILSVDGDDAVAVYRVMQESVLRARSGGGPAVLWSVLPDPRQPRLTAATPLSRLKHYLRARKISL